MWYGDCEGWGAEPGTPCGCAWLVGACEARICEHHSSQGSFCSQQCLWR